MIKNFLGLAAKWNVNLQDIAVHFQLLSIKLKAKF